MKTVHTIVMLSLITFAGALASGCDAEPTPQADEASLASSTRSSVAVDSLDMAPIVNAVQAGQIRDGVFTATGTDHGREIAPGVSELETGDGVQQIVVGEAGHQWLLEQSTARLEQLHAELAESDDPDALLSQIAATEEEVAATHAVLKHMRDLVQPSDGVHGPSCNVGFYAGPSSPVYGSPGAAALAQSVCYGGCAGITVRSQACCNGACTPLSHITNYSVCSAPWTAGSIRLGGGYGQAQVNVGAMTATNLGFTCS